MMFATWYFRLLVQVHYFSNVETGVLRLHDDDYLIEPMSVYVSSSDEGSRSENGDHSLPHVIYKRSSIAAHKLRHYEGKDCKSYKCLLGDDGVLDASTSWQKQSVNEIQGSDITQRVVETLVVVDQSMYKKHGKENITTYVLSMLNIVSQLFKDQSIGEGVDIVLVGLILLETDEPGLHISHHADVTLNSFCQWQATLGEVGTKHHDHAVLLTSLDICAYRNAPCDTLGFAPIKGMCHRLRSCSINEDTGLTTAFTIAHEIGHNFGMFHDGDGNHCQKTDGNIMSPTLKTNSGTFHWSMCSRGYLKNFFESLQSACLVDGPVGITQLTFPEKLPGQIFDIDTQCRWQFGSSYEFCRFELGKPELCQSLWCYEGGMMCETKFLPAAEGTVCGHGMWCIHGNCVRSDRDSLKATNGGWSEWSVWSDCTRTCGGGVWSRSRECTQPEPSHGGQYCRGDEKVYQTCNTQHCLVGDGDIRRIQCEQYNRKMFRGSFYNWIPYRKIVNEEDRCRLHCRAVGYGFFYAMSENVVDGTPCREYSTDVCLEGICTRVGCDMILGSSAKVDACGICRGDNSTCHVLSGTINIQPERNTYYPLITIPKNAKEIHLEEKKMSRNYLALRNTNGKYFLNGIWKIDKEGVYKAGGSEFVYKHAYNSPASLTALGPLTEDLVLELFVQGENPGIRYQYSVPRYDQTPDEDTYSWSIETSECTQPCGGGERVVSIVCLKNGVEPVSTHHCDSFSEPVAGTFPCNTLPCQPRWHVETWGPCSRRCGGGKQKRRVLCKQKFSHSKDIRVKKKLCYNQPMPLKKQICNVQACPPVWRYGKWSQCSANCGKGLKTRTATCQARTKKRYTLVPQSMCQSLPEPRTQKPCRMRKMCCHRYCIPVDCLLLEFMFGHLWEG
ncbi:hypothetical protein ScPMuIL_001565 [Solemya velum]